MKSCISFFYQYEKYCFVNSYVYVVHVAQLSAEAAVPVSECG